MPHELRHERSGGRAGDHRHELDERLAPAVQAEGRHRLGRVHAASQQPRHGERVDRPQHRRDDRSERRRQRERTESAHLAGQRTEPREPKDPRGP
ncbi:hypothetical protein NYE40_00260 [Paenibacillus sp. FSL W8-1187]|uniref:hypothetical protein n=1 Tax=Paenibacillus sp. FSL W8-1187 TaxID=2975339 RepID=UPI0030D9CF34